MAKFVFCIAKTEAQAIAIVDQPAHSCGVPQEWPMPSWGEGVSSKQRRSFREQKGT